MIRTRSIAVAVLALAGLASIAACRAPGATPGASDGAAPSTPAASPDGVPASPASGSPASSAAGTATQTDTEWGRIWDALPPSFPAPDGVTPATDTGEGATSAQLSVPRSVGDVAAFYVSALDAAGWSANRDGPLEDGSIDVTATKGEGCQLAISILPFAEGSLVRALYGAGCPFE